jgi:hypothetical protein
LSLGEAGRAIRSVSRRASSVLVASSFSAMARSFSTARARRAKVASSAFCCSASKVGVCRARSSSLVGARLVSRTDTTATPISASAGASARTASRVRRNGSGPASSRAPIGFAPRCCSTAWPAMPLRRASIRSIGSPCRRPVARLIEKSTRLASSSGSTTCQPIVPWTATVWKSRLRPRTNSVVSRSSTGTSLMLAVSGRNQKTSPRPLSRMRPPR